MDYIAIKKLLEELNRIFNRNVNVAIDYNVFGLGEVAEPKAK